MKKYNMKNEEECFDSSTLSDGLEHFVCVCLLLFFLLQFFFSTLKRAGRVMVVVVIEGVQVTGGEGDGWNSAGVWPPNLDLFRELHLVLVC